MLAKEQRLRKDGDITRVAKRGHSFFTTRLIIKFVPTTSGKTRATVLVSLKFSKKSTARNRIKRQVRAALGPLIPKLKKGFDIVITVKNQAALSTVVELAKDLQFAFTKTGLL